MLYMLRKKSSLSLSEATFMYFFLNVLSYYLTNTTIFFLFKSLHSFLERPMQVVFKTEK